MKRVVICGVLLTAVLFVCWLSYDKVARASGEINAKIDVIASALEREEYETLDAQVAELVALWVGEEKSLARYIRNHHIDGIAASVRRLPALAAMGEYGELASELAAIRWQMEHLRDSELPRFDNFL